VADRHIRLTMVLEQHLGHRTYAEHLQQAAATAPDIDAAVVPVRYEAPPAWARRMPLPAGARSVLSARREIAQGLGQRDADVHLFNTQVPAVIGGRRCRAVPYIVVSDVTPIQYDRMAAGYGHRADRPGPMARAKHAWNRHVVERACRVVSWSTWTRDSFVDDYGVDPARAEVIAPGVDTARWAPSDGTARDGPARILFVGGDFHRKGGDDLLHAFGNLPRGSAELTLVTKSPVPRAPDVEVVADIEPNDDRLVHLMRTSDVFVLPSRAETFGIAAVEASAAGLAVIVTNVGGFPDIVIDGRTGLTVTPGDRDALARSLARLVGDGELRRRLGAGARQRALAHFDAAANGQRMLDLVRACAQRDIAGRATSTRSSTSR
jgi:glycosyltransferase involved in cell wall biosynthesis